MEFSGGTLSLLLARGVDIGGGTRDLLWTARRETGSAVTLRFNRYNSRGDVVGQSDAAGVTTWAATYQADGRRTGEVGTNLNPKHATGRVRELGVNRDRHRANSKEEDPTGLLNEGFRYRHGVPVPEVDPELKNMKPIHFAALISALFASASCTSPNTMRTPRNYHFEISNALQIYLGCDRQIMWASLPSMGAPPSRAAFRLAAGHASTPGRSAAGPVGSSRSRTAALPGNT